MDKYIISTRRDKKTFKVHYLSHRYICENGKEVKDSSNGAFETFLDLTEEQIKDRGGMCCDCCSNKKGHMQYGTGRYRRR